MRVPPGAFASIVAIAADAIISVDASQRIIFFNEGATEIFGYAAEEVLGRPLEMLLPPRFRNGHHAQVSHFGRGHDRARRMGERREIAGMRRGGEEFPAEASISRVTVEGQPIFTVVLRDISERKRAADRMAFLAEAGEALAASLDVSETLGLVARLPIPTLADAVVVELIVEGALTIEAAHREDVVRQALLGARRATMRAGAGALEAADDPHPLARARAEGGTIAVSVDVAAPPAWLPAAAAGALVAGSPSCEVDPRADATGAPATLPTIEALAVPLRARGETLGSILLLRCRAFDADDRTLAEDLARRAALAANSARLHDQVRGALRLRDDMAGIVSHDLRNPVQAVKMLAGAIAAARADVPPRVLEHAAVIRQAAEQMDMLIQDLLDAARLDSGRLHVTPRAEPATALLASALEPLLPLANARGQRLTLHAGDGLPMVQADRARIGQVLSNLVGNAIKFTPAGGAIDVSAAADGRHLVVRVSDTGPGIPVEQRERVFDRYVQLKRGQSQGAGLGLPIAKGIVEAHGGRLWYEPRAEGGSVFAFTLPVAGE